MCKDQSFERPECFIPEKDNPYPLCIGRKVLMCENCQLRVDWEPEDPYGVGERKYIVVVGDLHEENHRGTI